MLTSHFNIFFLCIYNNFRAWHILKLKKTYSCFVLLKLRLIPWMSWVATIVIVINQQIFQFYNQCNYDLSCCWEPFCILSPIYNCKIDSSISQFRHFTLTLPLLEWLSLILVHMVLNSIWVHRHTAHRGWERLQLCQSRIRNVY